MLNEISKIWYIFRKQHYELAREIKCKNYLINSWLVLGSTTISAIHLETVKAWKSVVCGTTELWVRSFSAPQMIKANGKGLTLTFVVNSCPCFGRSSKFINPFPFTQHKIFLFHGEIWYLYPHVTTDTQHVILHGLCSPVCLIFMTVQGFFF